MTDLTPISTDRIPLNSPSFPEAAPLSEPVLEMPIAGHANSFNDAHILKAVLKAILEQHGISENDLSMKIATIENHRKANKEDHGKTQDLQVSIEEAGKVINVLSYVITGAGIVGLLSSFALFGISLFTGGASVPIALVALTASLAVISGVAGITGGVSQIISGCLQYRNGKITGEIIYLDAEGKQRSFLIDTHVKDLQKTTQNQMQSMRFASDLLRHFRESATMEIK